MLTNYYQKITLWLCLCQTYYVTFRNYQPQMARPSCKFQATRL